jgi:hypothetical protein
MELPISNEERGAVVDFIPIHPGEVLLKDFMEPMGISHDKLASALCISA